MPILLTCSRGHRWENDSPEQPPAGERPAVCPVCGEAVDNHTSSPHDGEQKDGSPSSLSINPPGADTVHVATRPTTQLDLPTGESDLAGPAVPLAQADTAVTMSYGPATQDQLKELLERSGVELARPQAVAAAPPSTEFMSDAFGEDAQEKLRAKVQERLLAPAAPGLESGMTVTFGPAPPTDVIDTLAWRTLQGHELETPIGASASADGPPRPDGKIGRHASTLSREERAKRVATPVGISLIPGYEILEVLGRGGMGVVYKAREVKLNRVVAIKMLLAGSHAAAEEVKRFRDEAEAVAQLRHENIVQIYGVGEVDDKPYFSLEFIDGGSLSTVLDGTPQPPEEAAQLAEVLARAVAAAHHKGIIHRDLKPANIMLTSDGIPKITDFGLAKRLEVDRGQTKSGAILGTPSYMSPEQAEGNVHQVGTATDIYSLGAMLYELLTGRPPFKCEKPLDTVLEVIQREPVPPRRLQPKLPRDLETICLKCLQKDQRKRYATAEALADDLKRFQEGRPILARPVPAWERGWKLARRHPAAALLASFLLFAVVTGGAAAVWATAKHNADLKAERDQANRDRDIAEAESVYQKAQADSQRDQLVQLQGARDNLTEAKERLAKLGPEADPKVAALQANIAAKLGELEPRIAAVKKRDETARARQKAQDNFQEFKQRYDVAFAQALLFAGDDQADKWGKMKARALDALKVFDELAGAGATHAANEHLGEADNHDLNARCLELWLVVAESEARSPGTVPTQSRGYGTQAALRAAVAELERAEQLARAAGPHHNGLRAVLLCRAAYLAQLGDRDSAASARAQAESLKDAGESDFFWLGIDAYEAAKYAEAITDFKYGLARSRSRFWPRYFLALCYLKQRQPVLARDTLEICLNEPSAPDLDAVKAWVLLLRGYAAGELATTADEFKLADQDFQDAADRLRAAETSPRLKADGLLAYCIPLYRGTRYVRQARDPAYAKERDRLLAAAAESFEAARKVGGGKFEAPMSLAEVRQQQGQLNEAADLLDLAVERARGQSEDLRASLHYRRGRIRSLLAGAAGPKVGQGQEPNEPAALADLKNALELKPAFPEAHLELGRMHYRNRDYAAARAAAEKAIELRKEGYAAGHRLKGEAELALKSYDAAAKSFDAYLVLRRTAADPNVYRQQALAYMMLQKYKDAVATYTKAVEAAGAEQAARRQPASAVARGPLATLAEGELAKEEALSLVGRGWAYVAGRDWVHAAADFEQAAKRDAGNGYARVGLGYARAKGARTEAELRTAVESARQGLELVQRPLPRPPGLLLTAAKVYAQASLRSDNRQYQDQAVDYLEAALSTFKNPKEAKAFWRESVQPAEPGDPNKRHWEPDLKPIVRNSKFLALQTTYGAEP